MQSLRFAAFRVFGSFSIQKTKKNYWCRISAALEEEKALALEEKERARLEFEKAAEKKAKVARENLQRAQGMMETITEHRKTQVGLMEDKKRLQATMIEKEEKKARDAAKRLSVERKLESVALALEKLEDAMVLQDATYSAADKRLSKVNKKGIAGVQNLKHFFEQKQREQAVRAKAVYEIVMPLHNRSSSFELVDSD